MKPVILLFLAGVFILLSACKKSTETFKPVLVTQGASNVTTHSARTGGTIMNEGGSAVTSIGVCYSTSTNIPTITYDSVIYTVLNAGSFTVDMTGLQSGTTYYVRSFAQNGAGVGYGQIMVFTTGNIAPEVTDLMIDGVLTVGDTLFASYTYFDTENDAEGESQFQWYLADDGAGSNESSISGANLDYYVIQPSDENRYIRFSVIPNAASGTADGELVYSGWVGPVVL